MSTKHDFPNHSARSAPILGGGSYYKVFFSRYTILIQYIHSCFSHILCILEVVSGNCWRMTANLTGASVVKGKATELGNIVPSFGVSGADRLIGHGLWSKKR